MIEIDEAVKVYAGTRVVDGVSLNVARGELCVLLGTSGSGKSTLLKLINRQITLDSGCIRIDGEDTARVAAVALRRRIGYAIQSIGLFPHWTIEDNIATVPRLLKWPQTRVRDRVTELLELLQLDPAAYRKKFPHQLSGGEQQRVGVARALAADPSVLLMDEPFGALDPITREALQKALVRIHKTTGKTIVFVTHDIDEALLLADRIAIMDSGRLIQHATPSELIEQPANDFVRDFIGTQSGLKLLALKHVADYVRAGESAGGEAISGDTTLRDALAQMLARKTDRLPVRDNTGRSLGAVRFADLLR